MATPRVVAWAREQFNCSSLTGFEIENLGQAGTGGSHWEQRTSINELMDGLNWRPSKITNLTLALFADMGYYAVNPALAEPMVWGWKAGCAFVTDRCSSATWSVLGGWCTDGTQESCSLDRGAKGVCFLQSANGLDPMYYYLPGPQAGRVATVDYCPIIVPYNDRMCEDDSTSADSSIGEIYGAGSRCFISTVTAASKPACFKTRCNAGVVEVSILDVWKSCPAGSTINGLKGTITCPSVDERFCVVKSTSISTSGLADRTFVAAPYTPIPVPKKPPSSTSTNAPSAGTPSIAGGPTARSSGASLQISFVLRIAVLFAACWASWLVV